MTYKRGFLGIHRGPRGLRDGMPTARPLRNRHAKPTGRSHPILRGVQLDRGVWPAQAPSGPDTLRAQKPQSQILTARCRAGDADSEKGCGGPHPQCQGGRRLGRRGDGLDTLFPGREPEASSDRESLQPPSSRLKKALRDPEAVFTRHSHQRAALNADSRPSSTLRSQPLEGAGSWNRHFINTPWKRPPFLQCPEDLSSSYRASG